MERIRLSPEDYSAAEMRRLTFALIKEGIRIFVFSFHSPSIEPGRTPYVQSRTELRLFLDKCRHYFDFFLNTLDGKAMTPVQIKRFLNENNETCDTGVQINQS
jgi:hypothetical protein